MSGELDGAAVSMPEFELTTAVDASTITVNAVGTADLRVKDALDSALGKVHDEALRLGSKEVAVDLRKLEFMNSSCLKCFVSWIGKIQGLERARQYHVRLLSRNDFLWQRRSLHALRSFAIDVVSVET